MAAFRRWLRQVARVPGEQGMVPPVLTDAQEGALQALAGFFALDMGWYAAVKARQVGMTTLLLLWSLWMILNTPGFVIIWVSPHDKIAAEVLAKFRAIATGCGVKWHATTQSRVRLKVAGVSCGQASVAVSQLLMWWGAQAPFTRLS